MFSASIQNLVNSSSVESAAQRASQLNNMIFNYAQPKVNKAEEAKLPKFSDLLKPENISNIDDLKFPIKQQVPTSKNAIKDMAVKIADKYGVNSKLVLAVIKNESNFNPNSISKAGAQGLMQLMPGTAKTLGVSDALNPEQNITGGVKHLKFLLEKYNGNMVLAIAAYNAGTGNVKKYDGIPPFKETQNYVKKVLGDYLT